MLLLGAAITCSFALWETFAAYDIHRHEEAALAGAKLKAKEATFALSPKRIEAVNQAIKQLNLPWQKLFDAMERNRSDRISLLALEPDASNRILRIQAEAKAADDMVDFVEALQKDALFHSASLIRHEINESDRNKPYRFTLEARWQTDF